MSLVEEYTKKIGKIIYDMRKTKWALEYDPVNLERKMVTNESTIDEIIKVSSIPTIDEFSELTEGLPFNNIEVIDTNYQKVEKDGIYIEVTDINKSIKPDIRNGRSVYIKQENKNMQYHMNTIKDKMVDCYVTEITPDGIYFYDSEKNEMRLVERDTLDSIIKRKYGNEFSYENNFIEYYNEYLSQLDTSQMIVLFENANTLLAGNIPSLEGFDEKKANELFKKGIKGYIDENQLQRDAYEEEMAAFTAFRR